MSQKSIYSVNFILKFKNVGLSLYHLKGDGLYCSKLEKLKKISSKICKIKINNLPL